ncbi:9383_t:CDS:2, partial [Paraglomus occultum]
MIDGTPVSMMAVEIHSTRLFGIESDASLGSLGLYCQTTWYRPKFYAEIETCLPTDLVCEVVLTDCTRFWEAKGLKGKVAYSYPWTLCQIRANSHYELVKGEKALANQSEMNKCRQLSWTYGNPVNNRPSSIMWRELMNNATKQINFVEYKSIPGSKCKVRGRTKGKRLSLCEMTNALARMSAQERDKELLSQFAVVLNDKKKKLRNCSNYWKVEVCIPTEDITEPSSIVNEEMSEEPKTTKRKAAPK